MRSHQGCRFLILALVCAALSPVTALAQIPDKFTNLHVLPKDIGKRELISIMRNFSFALGVRCDHCHASKGDDELEEMDFASDDLEAKATARGMMKMVQEINDKLLPSAGVHSSHGVRCATCHGGVAHPEGLDQLLLEVVEKDGVEAATKRYRELREEYYGSAAYDFSPQSLNRVAEALAEKQDMAGAIAMLQLNLEMKETAYTHLVLAQIYAMSGETQKARDNAQRALELEPDNGRAKQMLDRLSPAE